MALGACASGGTPAPEAVPPAPQVEAIESVADLTERSELSYWRGVDAMRLGRTDEANDYFDAAVAVFMDADVPEGEEAAFREAFGDLVTRVHTQQLDDFQLPVEGEATDLASEEIPALSSGEIDMLRARIADTLPELPRFSIPVPYDHPKVLAAVEYLSTDRAEVITEGLTRAQAYLPMIRATFAEAGVPQELAWIPLIESLYKPWVRSRASAVGMWQFMAPTARLYGLKVDWYVDERRDPWRATQAIANFIKDYYEEFGDWHLAIAAYNGGKGRVARAMSRAGVDDFWSLADTRHLPRETREFVPKILAAIIIGSDPEAYGLQIGTAEQHRFDQVSIDTMTDLAVIAEAAGTDVETITELNPHLLRRTTPNIDHYVIRVPAGTAEMFRDNYAAIPVSERVRFVEYRIRTGDTLSRIATEFDTSVAAISDLNGLTNRHRIRAGHTLLIPAGQPVVAAVARNTVAQNAGAAGEKVTHSVRRGENLSVIAGAYGTTVNNIKRWNGLASDTIYQGDRLDVYVGVRGSGAVAGNGGGSASDDRGPTTLAYVIQRGDTLSSIARIHGVGVSDIRSWNGMRTDRIYPGETLTIHSREGTSFVTSTYTVRRGDTLTSIAQRFGVSVDQICAWNEISRRTTLFPGNRLQIRSRVANSRQ